VTLASRWPPGLTLASLGGGAARGPGVGASANLGDGGIGATGSIEIGEGYDAFVGSGTTTSVGYTIGPQK
jgi:hypothetical protein